jgi:hypothetical protein
MSRTKKSVNIEEKIDKDPVEWKIDLSPLMGKMVKVEFINGKYRNVEIKKVESRNITLGGSVYQFPVRLMFDDMFDWANFDMIKSIKLLDK